MSVSRDIVYLSYFYYFAYITYWYAYSLVSDLPILCVVLHVSLNILNGYLSYRFEIKLVLYADLLLHFSLIAGSITSLALISYYHSIS